MTSKTGYMAIPLDKLIKAEWNYKKEDKEQEKRLRANIEKNGFIENLVVREIENGYEVVNGNHRLDVLKRLGITQVMCYNIGKISEIQAKRIAIELNETRFPSNADELTKIIEELSANFELTDLETTLPKEIAGLGDLSKILEEINTSVYDESKQDDISDINESKAPISKTGDLWYLGFYYIHPETKEKVILRKEKVQQLIEEGQL